MKRKIITLPNQCKNDVLDIAVDVSKRSLNYYAEHPSEDLTEIWEGKLCNRGITIVAELEQLKSEAQLRGYRALRIVCESTGIYHRRLLVTARQCGCYTCMVSGEAVHKSQVIQSNSYNKTDTQDPKTILLVARTGKCLEDRALCGGWLVLRQLNLGYERIEKESTQLKNRLHAALYELFCDLGFKNEWIFESAASHHVAELYGLNPYRIVKEGKTRFTQKLRRRKLIPKTIKRLWDDARQSVLSQQDPLLIEWLEQEVHELYKHLAYLQEQQHDIRYRMVAELDKLHVRGEIKTNPHHTPIGPFMYARILAETGSLGDFAHSRQLLKYAGLNLFQKESGTMKGLNRLSKKGRSRLRYCAKQACVKLVVRGQLFGEVYHAKKAECKSGNKAMTAMARKLLRVLHGIEKNGGIYQPERVFEQNTLKPAA